MHYISTRGDFAPRSFLEILLAGLANDGGLYVPESYPQLDLFALRRGSYQSVAFEVLRLFAPDIPPATLRMIITDTYSQMIFGSPDITPLRTLDGNLAILELSNGPTLAFKDVALQLLGNLMEYALTEKNEELNVLGATSGDTGSAAEYALRGRKGVRIFMLSPYGRMSRFQQRQMYTLSDKNVFNLVIDGTFDDCQSVVKDVNADAAFKKQFKLGAVNSINWARIAAQVVYYVFGYLRGSLHNGEEVTFCVPSGNFGNALAAYIAQRMGVPIKLIVATNENDVLHEFFQTGVYQVRKSADVKVTSSPSMDIASASNFERLIFDLVDRNPETVRRLWDKVKRGEAFDLKHSPSFAKLRDLGITSGMASEQDVIEAIRTAYKKYTAVIDPHTAVGMHVALQQRDPEKMMIVTETAQAVKFANTINIALGFDPPIPYAYRKLDKLGERTYRMGPDPEAVKRFISSRV